MGKRRRKRAAKQAKPAPEPEEQIPPAPTAEDLKAEEAAADAAREALLGGGGGDAEPPSSRRQFLARAGNWTVLACALGAVAGTFLVMLLFLTFHPGDWEVVDWAVTSRMEDGIATALEVMRLLRG